MLTEPKQPYTRSLWSVRALEKPESKGEDIVISEPNVSRLEQRDDILVSTLRQVVEAMGGELELQAAFPEGRVRLTRYENPRSKTG